MLARFFIIAFAICWAITIPIALNVQGLLALRLLPMPAQWLIGFAPLVAAWWVTRGSTVRTVWLSRAFELRVGALWYIIAVGLPWLVLGVAMGFESATGRKPPQLWFDPTLAPFGVAWLVLAFGEEAGWRGFALPEMLKNRGFWPTSTVLGAVWCIWHYPKLFSSPYLHLNAEGMSLVAQFSVQILVANYLICWLFVRTQSAIITTLFHTSMNVVATAYSFAALDPVITVTMAAITLGVLVADRARLRSTSPAT